MPQAYARSLRRQLYLACINARSATVMREYEPVDLCHVTVHIWPPL
jgi:hypothetical protein